VNAIRYTGLSFMLKRLGSFADTPMAGKTQRRCCGIIVRAGCRRRTPSASIHRVQLDAFDVDF
jgi:hypothetical protein